MLGAVTSLASLSLGCVHLTSTAFNRSVRDLPYSLPVDRPLILIRDPDVARLCARLQTRAIWMAALPCIFAILLVTLCGCGVTPSAVWVMSCRRSDDSFPFHGERLVLIAASRVALDSARTCESETSWMARFPGNEYGLSIRPIGLSD